jgi:PAS domain S-box-containing protein
VDGIYRPLVGVSRTASLTGEIIRTRKPAMLTKAEIAAWRESSGLTIPACSLSEIWLGAPLLVQQKIIGVMAVQSYTDPGRYDQTDLEVMTAVADQVAIAIESKRATDALQESIERYQTQADATFEAIFISENGVCLDTNQTAARMFGYRQEELIGIYGTELMAPESKPLAKHNMLSGYEKPYQVLAQRKDGTTFHAEIRGKMMHYKGRNVRIAVVRDIDEHKRAEKALKKSERRFRELAELLPETIFETDIHGTILFANKNGIDQFGYKQKDLENGLNAFDLLAAEEHQRAGANIARVLAGEPIGLSEYTARRKDGTLFPVMLLSTAILQDNQTTGLRGFIIDLTERKRLESQLQHAQKMEAIGTLAGGIAHDFNNILAAILGYAEMSLMDSAPDSALYYNSNQILKASLRAKDLVEQILSFSRQKDLKKKPIQVGPIVKEAVKLLRATLPTTIAIETQIAEKMGVVDADPTQIHQIMMNLGANAGQAMGEGGGTLTVRLEEVQLDAGGVDTDPDLYPGRYLVWTISDTGGGIPREMQQRVFEPFFTTKTDGTGTGMGLAVVHGIVKSHGGAITLQSREGQGATFTIFLPLLARQHPEKGRTAPDIATGSESVLLVDDERLLTDMGSQMLKHLGYRVTATNSSAQALEMFKHQPDDFDLVITDMTMPHLTGDSLARKLIALRSDIPIIICTGFNESLTPMKSESIGIKAFLMKPFEVQEMAATIRQVLDG